MEELFDFLIKKDVEYKRNQLMSQYTSVRIGGRASVVVFPRTEQQLIDVARFLCDSDIKHKVIGRMTNILPCDGEYCGVLISTKKLNSYILDSTVVKAECGTLLSPLLLSLARLGLGGAEGLCGIPGTVGGVIVSNAGAYGCEIGELVRSVRAYFLRTDSIETLTREQCGFSYRNSVFSNGDSVILSVELELIKRAPDIIINEMGMIKRRRNDSQPIEYPSLGSVFKKVNGISAGQIIDRCGLKGLRVGGAMVSPKHAGFIVNTGGATAADFRGLVELVKSEVYRMRRIKLIEEIEYI